MATTLFYAGVLGIGVNLVFAPMRGFMKPEVIAFPFMCFVGAATARYLGM